jgi:hypothetical protein
MLSQLLLSLCAVALSHGDAADDVRFKVGSPASLLGHQQMVDWNVQWPDASLFAIRNKTGYAFFMEGGPPGDTPGTPWTIMSSGTSGGLAVQERIATGVTIEGFPCPPGFPSPCIRLDPDPGSLNLLPCDGSLNQQWNFSSGKAVNSTNVQSLAAGSDGKPGGCWEINGCGGPDVDTNFGCKRLPKGLLPCIGCCNMAWRFLDNGTIVSGMRGKGGAPQCLHANPTRVVVGLCTGSVREIWQVVGRTIRPAHAQAHDRTDSTPLCIDNRKLPSETANTVGAWVGNVYHDVEADDHDDDRDGVLMLIHMEFRTATTDGVGCYFRFGLAYSSNGPVGPFNWCGYVAEPAVSFEHTVHGHKYGRPDWFPNMGLPSYIVRDGFMHVLYGDTNELGADGRVRNISVPGSAGNPDQGVAIVRANLSEVLAAARAGGNANKSWHKWYNGSWSQPALGGGSFTPLNLPSQGYMHGYCTHTTAVLTLLLYSHHCCTHTLLLYSHYCCTHTTAVLTPLLYSHHYCTHTTAVLTLLLYSHYCCTHTTTVLIGMPRTARHWTDG